MHRIGGYFSPTPGHAQLFDGRPRQLKETRSKAARTIIVFHLYPFAVRGCPADPGSGEFGCSSAPAAGGSSAANCNRRSALVDHARLPPDLLVPLCRAVAIATDGLHGPAEPTAIHQVRRALAAAAAHPLPGLPLLVQLEPPDLALLAAEFGAGAKLLDAISEAQHQDLAELLGERRDMARVAVPVLLVVGPQLQAIPPCHRGGIFIPHCRQHPAALGNAPAPAVQLGELLGYHDSQAVGVRICHGRSRVVVPWDMRRMPVGMKPAPMRTVCAAS